MGQCHGKRIPPRHNVEGGATTFSGTVHDPPPTPARSLADVLLTTPRRFFKLPFPPPSPAKHIKASLAKRFGNVNPKEHTIPEDETIDNDEQPLDKNFGYNKNFDSHYELGMEMGRGQFGYTCVARVRKGVLKDQEVAVKIISKSKMVTAISIEDIRREVKILKSLSGHKNLVKYFDSFEDSINVYIVMELCEGGELFESIISRGGRIAECHAKGIVMQILSVVSFCHLQGVIHRDLKPENFLFHSKDNDGDMKLIDFGLSNYVKPDEKLSDIVGSAYYVAPEVLRRSYNVEADIWSIGVITYVLLCGNRPFWSRTESGIFNSILRNNPNFDDLPWPTISLEAIDFVKRLLNRDFKTRMTASQALTHPWLLNENYHVPLDLWVFKLLKLYLHSTPLKRAAQRALSKALTENEFVYLRAQFMLLEPDSEGFIGLDNLKMALARNATEAMKESKIPDILNSIGFWRSKMNYEEFCAAAISSWQLGTLKNWKEIACNAFIHFECEGNRVISVEELAWELHVGKSGYIIMEELIRSSDGKLKFRGFTAILDGPRRRFSIG
ncbi:CDPK-related kinase 3-like [Impatiens glandulifera]|uniref:CDPK-related kinase 3-like n=1 Tax=Impatiens glandulifera TaxID=253017 RepID=UPI001FB0AF59|nr:CDPK-related kinase 3-like [Impatiens glandulifera]